MEHRFVHRLKRVTDYIPLRWSGLVLLTFLGGLFYFVGYLRQDLVLLVSCTSLLGLCLLLILAVVESYFTLSRRLRKFQEMGLGEGKQQLLSGHPFQFPLGFSLPYRPLVEVDWRWVAPEEAQVRLIKTVDGWMEEIQFGRRCLVSEVERCIEIRDVLGVASLRKRFKRAVTLEVLPVPTPLDAQTFVTSMHTGDEISDHTGEPVGDRMDMRRYAAGDPPRFILWKVYARSGKLMVRIPERALSPTPRTCAYLVAGQADEECAGVARAVLEKGVLGAGWRFGADGSNSYATTVEDSLTLLARSGNASRALQRGLQPFLEQARKDGYQSCLVLLPASYGSWIPEVEKSLRAGGLDVTLLVVDSHGPGETAPSFLHKIPKWDKVSRWLLAPSPEFQGQEPKRVLSRFSQSGHRALVYHFPTAQVRPYYPGVKKG